MTNQTLLIAPEWTETHEKSGLDPLGMQNSSIHLYQNLLPGISNVTLRIRYYGLYAWLNLKYSKNVGNTNPEIWKRYIRRAEALYALAAQLNKEVGVAGSNWANAKLNETTNDIIKFKEDADPKSLTHYLKQAWGAYGAAYSSQLFVIGIFVNANDHEIPVLTKIGIKLAETFTLENSEILDKFWATIEKGEVSKAELEYFLPILPSNIGGNSIERDLYQQILFPLDAPNFSQNYNRKSTLFLIMLLAEQKKGTLNPKDVRWSLYSSFVSEKSPFSIPESLKDHQKQWWAYHANDLSHICFEALLKYTLDLLETQSQGVQLAELIRQVVENVVEEIEIDGVVPDSWEAFLSTIEPAENAAYVTNESLSDLSLSEQIMTKVRGIYTAEDALNALRLLAILHRRIRGLNDKDREILSELSLTSSRSITTEISYLERYKHESFSTVLMRLIEERVVQRHLGVAMRKLASQGDYTFLFESDNGLIRLRAKDNPVYTTPRLSSALSFLKDIQLIDITGLTKQGKQLIEFS